VVLGVFRAVHSLPMSLPCTLLCPTQAPRLPLTRGAAGHPRSKVCVCRCTSLLRFGFYRSLVFLSCRLSTLCLFSFFLIAYLPLICFLSFLSPIYLRLVFFLSYLFSFFLVAYLP
jgi:hypothetical protein